MSDPTSPLCPGSCWERAAQRVAMVPGGSWRQLKTSPGEAEKWDQAWTSAPSPQHMFYYPIRLHLQNTNWKKIIKNFKAFPGGAVVENLPVNSGDTGSSPGLGRSHMPRSNWAREPRLLRLRVWSLCSATREAAMVRGPRTAMKSGPRLPQLGKALAQKRRPNTAVNK